MSIARGLGQNGGRLYSNITKPCQVDLQFTVNAADTGGLGVKSVKSNGYVRNVFMHTSQTPGSNDGATNPNPAAGYALIQLKNNFNKFLSLYTEMQSPNSTTQLTSTTNHNVYVIGSVGSALGYSFTVTSANATQGATYTNNSVTFTVLSTISGGTTLVCSGASAPLASGTLTKASGTGDATITFSAVTTGAATTLAQWQAAGLPAGLTPTVGQSFVATQTAAIGGSAWVSAPSISGNACVEVVGDPNQSIANSSIAANGGAYLLVQFLSATNSSTTTLIPTAPADGTIVSMRLNFDGSSVTIDGL
jgi:hypothetical protein